uniref:Uncharacterized protein n=1 Tax=Parascaris equorum TaxID=6256 RepID=A0A914S5U5_PAREQ
MTSPKRMVILCKIKATTSLVESSINYCAEIRTLFIVYWFHLMDMSPWLCHSY